MIVQKLLVRQRSYKMKICEGEYIGSILKYRVHFKI